MVLQSITFIVVLAPRMNTTRFFFAWLFHSCVVKPTCYSCSFFSPTVFQFFALCAEFAVFFGASSRRAPFPLTASLSSTAWLCSAVKSVHCWSVYSSRSCRLSLETVGIIARISASWAVTTVLRGNYCVAGELLYCGGTHCSNEDRICLVKVLEYWYFLC